MTTEKKGSGNGCLIRGCLLLMILVFLFMGFFAWGAYSLYKHLYALTSDAPITLPVYQGVEYPEVKQRLEAFQSEVNSGKPATLRLTANDMNALVANDPEYAKARGRLYFAIKDGHLSMQASVPLDGMRGMGGRWFNGSLTLDLKIENGSVSLIPKSVEAGGRVAPDEVLKALQSFPWTDQLNAAPRVKETLSKVKSLRFENDTLVLECGP